jgi:hypothetical protein
MNHVNESVKIALSGVPLQAALVGRIARSA